MVGVFQVKVRVFALHEPDQTREVDMWVDTGASHPIVPMRVAQELGLSPLEEREFTLANGEKMGRRVAWAGLGHGGRTTATVVIVGESDDPPLLGALALEGMGLEVDSQRKMLRPATQWLLTAP